ncbi:hypothetical protein F5879DRAFT_576901 [Lentinula edodes]|nr:hypothetical protein F5879DRAFT_576901 [Lentinula edodes]
MMTIPWFSIFFSTFSTSPTEHPLMHMLGNTPHVRYTALAHLFERRRYYLINYTVLTRSHEAAYSNTSVAIISTEIDYTSTAHS